MRYCLFLIILFPLLSFAGPIQFCPDTYHDLNFYGASITVGYGSSNVEKKIFVFCAYGNGGTTSYLTDFKAKPWGNNWQKTYRSPIEYYWNCSPKTGARGAVDCAFKLIKNQQELT